MKSANQSRQANIELLRILAMFGIILMHMMNHGGLLTWSQKGTFSYVASWMLFSPGMHSINILLLISGYFLVEQRFSTWKLYKLASQVLFYSLPITLIFWFFLGTEKDTKYLVYSLLPITSDFYWYISMYAGLYLLSPILNKLIRALGRKQMMCVCVLLFALISVWPNVAFFSSTLNTAGGVSIAWFVAVYFFGAYIRLYYVPDGKVGTKAIISLALLTALPLSRFFFEWIVTTPLGKIDVLNDLLWGYSLFYNYSSILVTITSIAVFITFLNIRNIPQNVGKWINYIASSAFGVYLLHDHAYIRDNFWYAIKTYDWPGKWYLIPLALGVAVLIYLAGMITEGIRRKFFGIWENRAGFKQIFHKMDDKLKSFWT